MTGLANDGPLLLDMREVERLTSLSRATLYRLIADGRLRTVHIGRSVRIPTSELRRFVGGLAEQDRVEPAPSTGQQPAEVTP